MVTLNCPICMEVGSRLLFQKKNRHFYICNSCGLQMQSPLPTISELQEYYNREFERGIYREFTDAEKMKVQTAEYRLKQTLHWKDHSGKWLDIGCANGVFVSSAAEKGINACGIELSQVAVDQAIARGLNVTQGRIEDLPIDDKFDCITAFDVIEHVLDPKQFLSDILERLNPNGICTLTLPNVKSIYSRLMGKSWWFYIPEEHLHYFSPKTMRRLAHRVGFRVVHIGRVYKPVTFEYGMTQFQQFNPRIFSLMKVAAKALPAKLQEKPFPSYLGEMLVVLEKRAAP